MNATRHQPTSTRDTPWTGPEPTVVVGTDGTDACLPALEYALQDARRRHAPLRVITVVDLPPDAPARYGLPSIVLDLGALKDAAHAAATAQVAALLDHLGDRCANHSVEAVDVTVEASVGQPATELVRAARGAAVLVVGRHVTRRWSGLLTGSVATRCLFDAACTVTVVPAADPKPRVTGSSAPVVSSPSSSRSTGASPT